LTFGEGEWEKKKNSSARSLAAEDIGKENHLPDVEEAARGEGERTQSPVGARRKKGKEF